MDGWMDGWTDVLKYKCTYHGAHTIHICELLQGPWVKTKSTISRQLPDRNIHAKKRDLQ